MSGVSDRNPFVGPRPIQRGEALHGRELETRELYNRLQARRIVVLHSPSGAGKSSLVRAGLIPRLIEGGYDVWKPIRVNLDPAGLEGVPADVNRYLLSALVSLEEELPAAHRRSPAQLAALDLLEYLDARPRRKARTKRTVVLLFDQFEEVLTIAPQAVEAKRAFFSAVGRALDSDQYWALFIIREDYLAALAPYRDRIPTQLSNSFRLDLLGREGAREAAVALAAEGGRSFPAVDELIRDLSTTKVQQPDGSFVAEQGQHVEPVHLQVVCRRLWDAMPDDDLSIDAKDIEAYAGVSEALAAYYSEAVERIAARDPTTGVGVEDVAVERAIREWVGQRLIVGGIRSQVRREPDASAELDNSLIQGLLDSYVVRTEQRAGAMWFELGHDRMVEPITRSNEAWERAHLHPLQVQAKLWEDRGRPPSLLLGPGALELGLRWARDNPRLVTEDEREFLHQSKVERNQTARRIVIHAAVTGAAVIAALVSFVLYRNAVEAQAVTETTLKLAHVARRGLSEPRPAPASDAAPHTIDEVCAHVAKVHATPTLADACATELGMLPSANPGLWHEFGGCVLSASTPQALDACMQ